jgi:hypothetical protein
MLLRQRCEANCEIGVDWQERGLGERRTASASGLTPFSIRETQYESCWRLRCVFCPVKEYSQLSILRSIATRAIQIGWETCKGTGTGGGTHQQRCDLVQDVDDFTRGLALIDFWCRRHGWGCNGVG